MKNVLGFLLVIVLSNVSFGQAFERVYGQPMGGFHWTGGLCYSQDRIYITDNDYPNNVPYSNIKVYGTDGKFLFDFGTFGSGDGQFIYPLGIVADKSGNLYVTDQQNHRIQKFDKNGKFITKWGSQGTGSNQFNYPQAIAIDKDGILIIVDNGNARIAKYTTDGEFKGSWGQGSNGVPGASINNSLTSISSVATNPSNGNIYLAEWKYTEVGPASFTAFVREFTTNGVYVNKWDTGLPDMLGIAVDPTGVIYVMNNDKKNPNGAFIIPYFPSGIKKSNGVETSNIDPTGICTDANGKVYVVDPNLRGLYVYEPNTLGEVSTAKIFGNGFTNYSSNADGKLNSPYATVIDQGGNVIVLDHGNNRLSIFPVAADPYSFYLSGANATSMALGPDNAVYVLDATTKKIQIVKGLTSTLWGHASFVNPLAITFNPDGDLLVTDKGKIFRMSKAGALLATITSPGGENDFTTLSGIATDPAGNIYVSDQPGSRIIKINKDGSFVKWGSNGSLNSQFNGPAGIAVGPDNHVYVADSFNHRIQEFTDQGVFVQAFGRLGSGERFFNTPNGITFSGDSFYISEISNHRVQKFNKLAFNTVNKTNATANSQITITGSGFGVNQDFTSFTINNVPITIAAQPNGNEATLTLPTNATTGYLSVTRDGISVFSKKEFVVGPVMITGFTPPITGIGRTIKITGSGFSPNNPTNIVTIAGIPATVKSSSFNELIVTIPAGVVKGKISVTVEGINVLSETDFVSTTIAITQWLYPESYLFGDPSADVIVAVEDPTQVKKVKFYYRGISSGETTYQSAGVPLPLAQNSSKYSIPNLVFTDPIGVKGYLALVDPNAVEVPLPEAYIHNTYPAASMGNAIPNLSFGKDASNYQLVSFPIIFKNGASSNVFKDLGEPDTKKWRLFGLKDEKTFEATSSITTITMGHSFWLIAKEQTAIRGGEGRTFSATETNVFELELTPGWNMIGNPYNFAISWKDVLDANSNPATVGTLRFFKSGSYVQGDILNAYSGAFVNNSGIANIKLKVPAVNKKLTGGRLNTTNDEQSFDKDHWSINLTVSDGMIRNELAGIGMNKEATEGLDRFDEQELPAPEGLNTFNLSMRKIGTKNIINDVVSTSDAYTWTGTLSASNGVTLEWRNDVSGGANKQLVMEIEGVAALVDMRSASTIDFIGGNHSFKIHYGDAKYVKEKTIVKEILVGDIAPNPLRKSNFIISVPVSVPHGGAAVSIRFLDMNGKSHFVAGERQLSEGRHVVEFQSDLNVPGHGMFIAEVNVIQNGIGRSFFRKVIID